MKCFDNVMNTLDLDVTALTIGFKSRASLSDYCTLLLGFEYRQNNENRKPLNKIWTKSDWRVRPLEMNQLFYAAIDAYVTRETYIQMVKLHKNNVSKMEMESAIQRLVTVKAEDWEEAIVTENVKRRFDNYFMYGLKAREDELARMYQVWEVVKEWNCLLV